MTRTPEAEAPGSLSAVSNVSLVRLLVIDAQPETAAFPVKAQGDVLLPLGDLIAQLKPRHDKTAV